MTRAERRMSPFERVAGRANEKPGPAAVPFVQFDLLKFIARNKLEIRKEKRLDDSGVLYELETCPFNADHKGGSASEIVRKHYAKWSPERQANIDGLLDQVWAQNGHTKKKGLQVIAGQR